MNLNQLELLRILQDTRFNLSKAAEKMFIVQSAVSRQLQLLELELGSPLIKRQGKRLLGFTALGEQIMQQIETISQAKKNILTIAGEHRDSDSGILHLATTHTQAKYFLPKYIKQFRDKYPKVKIYIQQSSPEHLIELLHNNQADIAICTEKVEEDPSLILNRCYEWHHAIVVPKTHALADGEITLQRLAAFPVLTYSFGFTGRSNIEKAFHQLGLEMDVVLAAADSDVIKTYVRLGFGVGLIANMAYDAEADQDLVIRSLAHLIPSSFTKVAYLKQNYLPAYSQHFIDELLNNMEKY
jgi:DNA-binding transcriptional LysR family regulator